MKILITADWQCELQNLEVCTAAWREVLAICERENILTVIVAGDLKRAYDPVNTDVVLWWQNAIRKAKKLGITVIVLLGNHDRTSQYEDNKNWFPILRKAGATCIDSDAEVMSIEDGGVSFLPFTIDKELLTQRALRLSKQGGCGLLIFHEDIRDCEYNVQGRKSEGTVQVSDLCADNYFCCVGGHVHQYQKIGDSNVYYVGSPFATDWGEANQKKGYLIYDSGKLTFQLSKIPGWFDPSWPKFWTPDSWKDCSVRVHAKCRDAKEYMRVWYKVREEAKIKYVGANIVVTADFEGGPKQDAEVNISSTDSDDVKIREYVKETCPDHLERKAVAEYLLSTLNLVGERYKRVGLGIRVLNTKAQNFLSFKRFEMDWTQKGITVVQGKNKDRGNRSNGSGKTGLVSSMLVALWGATIKGQKHDRWARRGCDDKAVVQLELRDTQNRIITIQRGRKPSKLKLWVNGKPRNIGMKSQQMDATQGEIEKLTGFTWQTFVNSIYIDQRVTRAFLQGTKSERTKVLCRLQNLERFDNALKAIRTDSSDSEKTIRKIKTKLAVLTERLDGLRKRLSLLVAESESVAREAWAEVVQRKKDYKVMKADLEPRINAINMRLTKAETVATNFRNDFVDAEKRLARMRYKEDIDQKELDDLKQATTYVDCPTCKQRVDKSVLKQRAERIKVSLKELDNKIVVAVAAIIKLRVEAQKAEGDFDILNGKRNAWESKLRVADMGYDDTYSRYLELKNRSHDESDAHSSTVIEIKATKQRVTMLQRVLKGLEEKQEFYTYCEKAVSRDGIPAFLNALLCPTLNLAAEYYSDIFGDKAVQVRFEMEDGEFVPRVLNATGGEDIDDQSEGELTLAGNIASFALREAAAKSNLLVLDEPGAGLDPESAKQFARALKELKSKFESIFVITHNAHMAQELEGENRLLVVKEQGVSRLVA